MARQENSSISDEALMEQYQAGDAEAFSVLYDRHAARVMGYLRSRASAEVASELLQETFLKLHRARHSYSVSSPFLPWLFAIARNAHLDFEKRAERKIETHSQAPSSEWSEPIADTSVDGGSSEVNGLLQSLSDQQRRIIELRYLSDWSFEQIAKDQATSPENIRQIVSRAIKRLKAAVGRGESR